MARYDSTATFDRRHSKLTSMQRAAFRRAVRDLNQVIVENGFAFPKGGTLDLHRYSGFERPPTVWSVDWDSNGRALFAVAEDVVVWLFIGTHDEIARWQASVGPRGHRIH